MIDFRGRQWISVQFAIQTYFGTLNGLRTITLLLKDLWEIPPMSPLILIEENNRANIDIETEIDEKLGDASWRT